jgi:hypothetical protein
MTVCHEATKNTKNTKEFLYKACFVAFVSLRAFVMSRR